MRATMMIRHTARILKVSERRTRPGGSGIAFISSRLKKIPTVRSEMKYVMGADMRPLEKTRRLIFGFLFSDMPS